MKISNDMKTLVSKEYLSFESSKIFPKSTFIMAELSSESLRMFNCLKIKQFDPWFARDTFCLNNIISIQTPHCIQKNME